MDRVEFEVTIAKMDLVLLEVLVGVGSSIPEKVNVKINMEREREVRFAVEVKANLERRGTGEKHNLPKSSSGQIHHPENPETKRATGGNRGCPC